MLEYPQNVSTMSEPMKELEGMVLDKVYKYDGNPVTTWMYSNVVCHTDAKDNIYPRKEVPENKIDGIVAQIMTISLVMRELNSRQDVVFL